MTGLVTEYAIGSCGARLVQIAVAQLGYRDRIFGQELQEKEKKLFGSMPRNTSPLRPFCLLGQWMVCLDVKPEPSTNV